ncbi:MAG: cysteine--tRNA ligase [Candidatus Micrarchaeota archaeon]|nr:cysteine--tRNA ligase [Candidatus Micrarchaeota archaeon]
MTRLLVYDTMTRRKREFTPIRKGEVRLYTCGPSVYSKPHLGNFRTYVFEDVVKRVLMFMGYRVRHVMNLTDIEDKAVRAARGDMKKLIEITRRNERIFMKDSHNLNIIPADVYPRATGSIGAMVGLINKLERKGLTFKDGKGNVFFDVSRFPSYGRLSRSKFMHPLDRMVYKDDYYQREAGNFALWKTWKKSDGNIFYDTELGRGRPGWHIECSAMSMRYLGTPFDIHMGGVDNIFAHHENEIAQSEGATGRKVANYWLHVRHLLMEGKKMSKSLGNFYTVDDIHRMGYDYDVIRVHLLGTHYRKRLNFTFAGLRDAAKELERCKCCARSLKQREFRGDNPGVDEFIKKMLAEFEGRICDDFDTPSATRIFCSFVCELQEFIKKKKIGKRNAKGALAALGRMDSVLGFMHRESSA